MKKTKVEIMGIITLSVLLCALLCKLFCHVHTCSQDEPEVIELVIDGEHDVITGYSNGYGAILTVLDSAAFEAEIREIQDLRLN